MAAAKQTSSVLDRRTTQRSWLSQNSGVLLALAAFLSALLLPTPETLPAVAGHRMLAILCIAVIIWVNIVRPEAGHG